MSPHELYQAGRLTEAITAAGAVLKQRPTDASTRYFLCELLCFAGELERADKQLDLIAEQDSQAAVAVALFRQLIRAEQWRQQFFREGHVPEFLAPPSPWLQTYLQASIAIRTGDAREAARLLTQAEAQRPEVRGTCNGRPIGDFRDLDDLCGGIVEVLTSTGKYYWVPVESIASMEFRPPTRARDLLWRQTLMSVCGGPDGEVYLPCLYAGAHENADDRVRLGRVTDWSEGEGGPTRGLGLKTFLAGDESTTILELGNISFEAPVSVSPADAPVPGLES